MASGERPVSEVLKDIFGNVQDIVRSEVRLAKVELREELAKYRRAAGWFALGSLAALFGVGFLLLAAFFALSYVAPTWAAAGMVALAAVLVAAVAFVSGTKHLHAIRQINASASAAQLKENVQWAKQQVK